METPKSQPVPAVTAVAPGQPKPAPAPAEPKPPVRVKVLDAKWRRHDHIDLAIGSIVDVDPDTAKWAVDSKVAELVKAE